MADLNDIEGRALRLEGALNALAELAAGGGQTKDELHLNAAHMASLFDLIASETHEIVADMGRLIRNKHIAA